MQPPSSDQTAAAPRRSRRRAPSLHEHLLLLDGNIRGTIIDLRSAQQEMRRYAQRMVAANAALERRRSDLQGRVHQRENQLGEKVKRLSILYDVGTALGTTLELDEILRLIVRLAARHLKARKTSLMLVDESEKIMRINSSVGIRKWIVERTRIRIGEGIAGMVAGKGEPVLITDIATDERFGRPSRGTYRTGSFLSAPLVRHGRILGVLNVSDKRSMVPFDGDDFRLVTTLASSAAIAVENALLFTRLKDQLATLEELYRVRDEERLELGTLINSVADGIVAVDTELRTRFVNARAAALLGIGAVPVGEPLPAVVPGDQFGLELAAGLAAALGGTVARREITRAETGGEPRHYELLSLPVRPEAGSAGGPTGALTVVRDVTETKELDRARADFLNRASHQLKTPVGLIRGFAETLVRHENLPEQKRRHFLELIYQESGRLAGLIDSFLDFNRIESRTLPMEKERVELGPLLERLLPGMRERAAERGIVLETLLPAGLPTLETDPTCLTEVLSNVLDNGIKYTPRGGAVTIEARSVGGQLEVTISDTGPGIDQEDLPHLFEKFYMGRAQGVAGTGLGLYIAREILNSMGGGISVTSRPGEGTTVHIGLPLPDEPVTISS